MTLKYIVDIHDVDVGKVMIGFVIGLLFIVYCEKSPIGSAH